MKSFFIAAHVVFNNEGKDTYGPPHSVFDFLKNKISTYTFVKHSLYVGQKSKITSNDVPERELNVKFPNNLVLMSLFHAVTDIFLAWKGFDIFIGTDPVNGISGVILKKFGRIKTFVYYSADYADTRFVSKPMNFVYHFIDRACLRNCNVHLAVSSRLVSKRKTQEINQDRIVLLPNSPDLTTIPSVDYDGNKNLVIVSHLSSSLDIEPILDAVSMLSKKFPDIKLNIVGTGPSKEEFEKLVTDKHLDSFVKFLGQHNHDEVLKIISESFLGFALYTADNTWNYYGDSMKAREYVACGVPVIINDVPSTADDVARFESGLLLTDIKVDAIYNFISKCLLDTTYYMVLRENALRMSKIADKKVILEEVYRNFLS